jgi:ComF family protein
LVPNPILDFLLPPRCGGCRSLGDWLCERCRNRIRRLAEPLCRRCGVELPSARDDCGCRGRLKSLTRLRSAVAYEGPIENAIHRFKYEGWRRLAEPLAVLVAERVVVEGLAAGCVVAVPLHAERLRQRGFNQSELLARHLRKRLSLEASPGELVRTRPTPPQVGHDRRWRLENVKKAFRWRGSPLQGQSILLVDDVATTGATLDACASALREAGSGPVIGVSVARVTV